MSESSYRYMKGFLRFGRFVRLPWNLYADPAFMGSVNGDSEARAWLDERRDVRIEGAWPLAVLRTEFLPNPEGEVLQ